MIEPRLVKSEDDRQICGIAGGLAHYLDIETIYVRMAFVALGVAGGIGIGVYLALLLVLPTEAEMAHEVGGGMLNADELRTIQRRKRNHALFAFITLLAAGVMIVIWVS